MMPLLVQSWTQERMLHDATRTVRPYRPVACRDRVARRRRAEADGGWRRAVGLRLVELGLSLAVRG